MNAIGKLLIIAGAVIILIGVCLIVFSRLKIPIGKLPGDIIIRRENFTFYFPLATSLLISLVLSLIGYFIFKK